MTLYEWHAPDLRIVNWSTGRMTCSCAYSSKMARAGTPYCSHIQKVIAERIDAVERRSISRACTMLDLPIIHDPARGICYGRTVRLGWSDDRSFEISLGDKVIGYGTSDTPRRTIIEMIWPIYVELHYAKPCSRCKLVVPPADLLRRDGLHRAVGIAASILHDGSLCADCADLVPDL